MYQINALNTLNLHDIISQLYFNKVGEKQLKINLHF